MPGLDNIKLNGYKSILDLDLKLRPLNVLIGANGSGKSNFISFFKLLNHLVNENLQNAVAKSGGANTLFYFGTKNTEKIQFNLRFGRNSYRVSWEISDDSRLYFSSETLGFLGERYDTPLLVPLGAGHFETEIRKESKRHSNRVVIADHVINNLNGWKVYHFHDTSDTSKMKQACPVNDNKYFREDASNLAAFLYKMKKNNPENYNAVLQTVQLVAPFIRDFDLSPMELDKDKIRLKWLHTESDEYFDSSQLSDGTLRFICIAVLLLQPDLPYTVILDEPELGLHPFAINLLASLLESVSKKTQVIISTQSLLLLDNFEPEDIVVVDYVDNTSKFRRLNSEDLTDWLDEYSIGELWEKNLLGGRPK
ncbi:AAA family ATPase [Priestia endophytica]|uniref:AAA family ATPase n=1 Tax=Priestia endophytica TaxID=135735 RepID=UPI00227F9DFD|nr:AAA family ATPase [Priestia endophytica]MCY8232882.1 AAA family ATPase [Priestia endophytica]